MDNEAFKKSLIQLQPGLQKVAESILNDADWAADAVQDTLLKIWDNRLRMNRVSNLEGYCVTAVKRRCIDLLREHLLPQLIFSLFFFFSCTHGMQDFSSPTRD